MEKSALRQPDLDPAPFADAPPVQHQTPPNIVAYPGAASTDAKQSSNRDSKRRRRFARFLQLETIALFFLVVTLAGATSQRILESGLTLAFQIAMVPSALAVALIPVIFYGPTRQEHRYRARRDRKS